MNRLFGSRIDRKIRNPRTSNAISYDIRKKSHLVTFVCRFLFFFVWCLFVSLFHTRMGLTCGGEIPTLAGVPQGAEPPSGGETTSRWVVIAEVVVSLLASFLVIHGHLNLRTAREKMERLRQNASRVTHLLLKATNNDPTNGYDNTKLQLVIYECLALITAYPVALLQQMRGNAYEPAVTRYCHEAAIALQQLRVGRMPHDLDHHYVPLPGGVLRHYTRVEYFFEIFSLNLEKEFRRRAMKSNNPSMGTQHIIYSILNHVENLSDKRNLDDRRHPLFCENIDMMALAGRDCSVFSHRDTAPVAFLWSFDLSARLAIAYMPVQSCDYIVNSTRNTGSGVMYPTGMSIVAMLGISAAGAIALLLLQVVWGMWDPFGEGVNTFAWSLGIAKEIDEMLHEYQEYDEKYITRRHSYMRPIPVIEEPDDDDDDSVLDDPLPEFRPITRVFSV